MKKPIIFVLFLVITLSVLNAEVIKVMFYDCANEDDTQGNRLTRAVKTSLANSREFQISDDFSKSAFVFSISTLNPDGGLSSNLNARTSYVYEITYYDVIHPLFYVDSKLGIVGASNIQSVGDQLVNIFVKQVNKFEAENPDLFK